MKKPLFKYDTRFPKHELRLFEDLIGKSISSFNLEHASILLAPRIEVSNQGSCTIYFYDSLNGPYAKLELQSLFKETPPVVDSGGIAVKKTSVSRIPTRTMFDLGLKYPAQPGVTIHQVDQTPVRAFRFYGSCERRALQEIDPDIDLEYMAQLGYDRFPELEVDTIEFLVIEHESNKRTVVSTCSGGFWYNFLTEGPEDNQLLYDSYMKVNGYEKNIVLQHEIR